MLQLRLELVTIAPPEAKTGLEGIGEANKILTQKGLKGLLIGSLVTDFWKTCDAKALAQHKDVDVAVLKERGKNINIDTFEGGAVDDSALDALEKRLDKELNPGHIEGNGIIALTQFVPYRFQLGVKNIPGQKFEDLFIKGKNIREIIAINSRKPRTTKD